MFWWLWELFSSVRFLSISGDKGFWRSKRIYEFVLPLVLSASIFGVFLYCPTVFAPDFLSKVATNTFKFMVFVVPFHLAALGAFATFERQILDERLKGTNAEVRVWSNEDSKYYYETLTMRQYVSLLFGYLCTLGIVFIVFYIFASSLNVNLIVGDAAGYLYKAAVMVELFFIAHYAFLSIYAITFLFDKVNGIKR